MNTSDLVKQLAKLLNIPQTQARALLHQELDAIGAELARGNEVVIRGFGKFGTRQVKHRNRAAEADTTVTFKAAPGLRDGIRDWRPS